MMICNECHTRFIPDNYHDLCNPCGWQLTARYESMQEWRTAALTLGELSGRAVWGWYEQPERCWVAG